MTAGVKLSIFYKHTTMFLSERYDSMQVSIDDVSLFKFTVLNITRALGGSNENGGQNLE